MAVSYVWERRVPRCVPPTQQPAAETDAPPAQARPVSESDVSVMSVSEASDGDGEPASAGAGRADPGAFSGVVAAAGPLGRSVGGGLVRAASEPSGAAVPSAPAWKKDKESLAAARQLVLGVWRLWRKGVALPAGVEHGGCSPMAAIAARDAQRKHSSAAARHVGGIGTTIFADDFPEAGGAPRSAWCCVPPPNATTAAEVLSALELAGVADYACSRAAAQHASAVAGPLLPPGKAYWELLELAALLCGVRCDWAAGRGSMWDGAFF